MPKYVAIFGAKKPLTPASYPRLFGYFTSLDHGARFADTVIGFHSDEERNDVIETLNSHLGPSDQVIVLQISAVVWHLDPKHDAATKKFLEASIQ